MQTFMPYPNFDASAACLDWRRLGKQRVEAYQILNTLTGRSTGWQNHPAVKMWRGHEKALSLYALVMCAEWRRRGYKDTMHGIISEIDATLTSALEYPEWVGDRAFHASHRSNLLRKDVFHYSQFGWTESPDLPYVWPV